MSTQTKLSHSAFIDEFRRWEIHFDAALKSPDTLNAWRALLDRQCDARALKSALYYAAFTWEGALAGC